MTQAPLHWIKQVEQTLINLQKIPLSGYPPPFPWEPLCEKLATLFQVPLLRVSLKQIKTLSGEALSQGFGAHPVLLELDLTPLEEKAFFLMAKEEINQLSSLALTGTQPNKGFLSPSFQEGFYGYLCTEVVLALNELNAFGTLSLKLGKPVPPPQEEALCLDIEIHHPKHTFFARVICPAALHLAFTDHFNEKPALSSLKTPVELVTTISIGQTKLPEEAWKKIRTGDVLLLDRCSFDFSTKRGAAFLCLEETPILRLRIKEDHLKIVNYVTYREEQYSMDPTNPASDENEELSYPDIDEKIHLNAPEEALISSEKVPLTLVVEAARIQISLEELLNLSPGNLLELPVRPQQGVTLTLQGKPVAKAELVKLGEMLGVKILKLAD